MVKKSNAAREIAWLQKNSDVPWPGPKPADVKDDSSCKEDPDEDKKVAVSQKPTRPKIAAKIIGRSPGHAEIAGLPANAFVAAQNKIEGGTENKAEMITKSKAEVKVKAEVESSENEDSTPNPKEVLETQRRLQRQILQASKGAADATSGFDGPLRDASKQLQGKRATKDKNSEVDVLPNAAPSSKTDRADRKPAGTKRGSTELNWLRKNAGLSNQQGASAFGSLLIVDQAERDRLEQWVADMKSYASAKQSPFRIEDNDYLWEGNGVYHHKAVKKYGYNFSPWQIDTNNPLWRRGWFQAAMKPIDDDGNIGHQTANWDLLPAAEQRVKSLSADPFSAWEEQLVEAMRPSTENHDVEKIEVIESGSSRARSSTHEQKVKTFREKYDNLYRPTTRSNARTAPNTAEQTKDEGTVIKSEEFKDSSEQLEFSTASGSGCRSESRPDGPQWRSTSTSHTSLNSESAPSIEAEEPNKISVSSDPASASDTGSAFQRKRSYENLAPKAKARQLMQSALQAPQTRPTTRRQAKAHTPQEAADESDLGALSKDEKLDTSFQELVPKVDKRSSEVRKARSSQSKTVSGVHLAEEATSLVAGQPTDGDLKIESCPSLEPMSDAGSVAQRKRPKQNFASQAKRAKQHAASPSEEVNGAVTDQKSESSQVNLSGLRHVVEQSAPHGKDVSPTTRLKFAALKQQGASPALGELDKKGKAVLAEEDSLVHKRTMKAQNAEDAPTSLVSASLKAKKMHQTAGGAKRRHPEPAQGQGQGELDVQLVAHSQQSQSAKRLKSIKQEVREAPEKKENQSTKQEEVKDAQEKTENQKSTAQSQIAKRAKLGSLWDLSEDSKTMAEELAGILREAEDAHDRAAAAQALRQIPWPATAHVLVLIKALQDPVPDVRGSAIQTLGFLPFLNRRNVASLAETLQDSSAMVRAAAVEALGNLYSASGSSAIVAPYVDSIVFDMLRDDHEVVRYCVVEMLKKMLGRLDMTHFKDAVKAATLDSDNDVKVAAQQLLSAVEQSVVENDKEVKDEANQRQIKGKKPPATPIEQSVVEKDKGVKSEANPKQIKGKKPPATPVEQSVVDKDKGAKLEANQRQIKGKKPPATPIEQSALENDKGVKGEANPSQIKGKKLPATRH